MVDDADHAVGHAGTDLLQMITALLEGFAYQVIILDDKSEKERPGPQHQKSGRHDNGMLNV